MRDVHSEHNNVGWTTPVWGLECFQRDSKSQQINKHRLNVTLS